MVASVLLSAEQAREPWSCVVTYWAKSRWIALMASDFRFTAFLTVSQTNEFMSEILEHVPEWGRVAGMEGSP